VADANGAVVVKTLLGGGATETAGLSSVGEWRGVEVDARRQGGSWRLNKLDDLALLIGPERRATTLLPQRVTTRQVGNEGQAEGFWPAL
jgi:hypothetical protein